MSNTMQLPNHTQLSNDFIDNWMGQLNGSSVKVFLAIARKTIGWHKDTDRISLTQLERLTGSARQTILDAIGRLENKGLVQVNRNGKINEFEIRYDSLNTRPVQKLDQKQSNNKTSGSLKTRHTKETNTKETKQNKYDTKYSIGREDKWDQEEPIDYASFINCFNDMYDQNRKNIESKHKQIRARLRVFTGEEIMEAWENRLNSDWLRDNGYMGDWDAAMRNDKKIETWLHRDNSHQEKQTSPYKAFS